MPVAVVALAAGSMAAGATAFAAATTVAGMVAAGATVVGSALTIVGTVTGNQKLTKIGAIVGVAGSLGTMAVNAAASAEAAGSAAGTGTTEAGTNALADAAGNGVTTSAVDLGTDAAGAATDASTAAGTAAAPATGTNLTSSATNTAASTSTAAPGSLLADATPAATPAATSGTSATTDAISGAGDLASNAGKATMDTSGTEVAKTLTQSQPFRTPTALEQLTSTKPANGDYLAALEGNNSSAMSAAAAAAPADGSLLSAATGYAKDLQTWAKENPLLAKAALEGTSAFLKGVAPSVQDKAMMEAYRQQAETAKRRALWGSGRIA